MRVVKEGKTNEKSLITRLSGDDERFVRVLIVEDDEDDVYLIKSYLNADKRKRYFFTVSTTLDGCVSALQESQYHVILLDLGLPDSEGLESLEKLATFGFDVPVVVLTGVDNDELGERAIQQGAEDYLPKKLANTYLLSRSISYSIERHRLLSRIRKQSREDPLTGLPNRLMIYDKLEFMINQSERSGNHFALVMMDFNKFKEINDTRGHRFGDELLKAFAERITFVMRKSDYVSRYGGDEFFMIVANYSSEEELRNLIKAKRQLILEPYYIQFDGEEYMQRISVSFGIMQWRPGETVDNMLEKADEAMYESKKSADGQMRFV